MAVLLLTAGTAAGAPRTGTVAGGGVRTDGVTGVAPVTSCASLANLDLSSLPEAPTRIVSASVVTPEDQAPPYCLVRGYVSPQNHFEVRLPTQTWRQRFLKLGCGGFCGDITFTPRAASGCAPLDNGTMAVAYDNSGHQSRSPGHTGPNIPFDGVWGHDGPQLRIDFGYRADHVVTLAAKALIKEFYGQPPKYSYFTGCSDGGRQGLMEAQRYPDDFDGVVAGAPALNFVPLVGELQPWLALANTGADGRDILGPDKLPGLHAAVMDRCDGNDGLVDGQIDDPRTCDFDPASITCPPGVDRPTCLTPAQVTATRKMYDGPVDSRGRRLYPGSIMRGGELAWGVFALSRQEGKPPQTTLSAENYLKHLAFWKNPPPSFTLADHKFDLATFRKLQEMSGIYDATNPDLSAFRRRGGKLILWHHWSDFGMPPLNTLNYYDALLDHNGGKAGVDAFTKLYMLPGPYHCGEFSTGDPTPGTFDLLTPLIDWVESSRAPGRVVVSRVQNGDVVRTRPVFPYPRTARYDGSGSIDDERNFVAVTPKKLPDLYTDWVGGAFKPGRQKWCTWNGTKLVCTRKPATR